MKKQLTRIFLLIAAIALIAFGLTGCQTADGLGKDIENLGENIQG